MAPNKRLITLTLSGLALLLLPLVVMQFTDEVDWSPSDFLVMGVLLAAAIFIIELILRRVVKKQHRVALCIVVLLVFLLVWAELGVGIFGSPFAGS
ncbi:hypothetical protein [Flagellimonas lutaonensis]|uniref:Membrane protein n=1 Tax=Flagellimonas lutaonensis TaxID=516051 RepID=A0A0D5YPD3_9FLAO|nr:hypothetical protein [Allomuricauda lutaonensis]AKA33804.1 membrane protein [Allomuricauda lutaonensis]